MDYSDFLQKFYLPKSGGGLEGYKSKCRTALFFFENGLDGKYDANIICPSDSTYEKWLTGTRRPESQIWSEAEKHLLTDHLLVKLMSVLNERNLRSMLQSFEVPLAIGESPDKRAFARAIAAQFEAIVHGCGSAENIVPAEYKKLPEPIGFKTYLRGAVERYKWIKLPGEEDCQLDEVYVCNNIGTSAAVFPHRIVGNVIENATLQKLRSYDRRGETKRILLVGGCGYGKTLMLQHLFLEAAEQTDETGCLPIFAELRNYSPAEQDLLSFIVATVQEYDDSFSTDSAKQLFRKGTAQLLLDGLDELNSSEGVDFQKRLKELWHKYPDIQIVVTSRQSPIIKGIAGFNQLYLHPLEEEQVDCLLDKLSALESDNTAKADILSFFDSTTGYVKKDGFIATNPMLLTVIARNHNELKDSIDSRARFYEVLYNELIRGHDEEKEAFKRLFHSVSDDSEFTEVFREFCAKTYMDGVYEFDRRTFEKYFKEVQKDIALVNPKIFTLANFQYDVCATACMMYEQESGIYYIDPGFQDYFFAEYYYFLDTDEAKKIGEILAHRSVRSFRNLDGLQMLYRMSADKAEVCVLLPYLRSIFTGANPEEGFIRFLENGFGSVTYTVLDDTQINEAIQGNRTMKFDWLSDSNSVKNVVMALVFSALDLSNTFTMKAHVQAARQNKNATHFLAGILDGSMQDDNPGNVIKAFPYELRYRDDVEFFRSMKVNGTPILSNSGKPIVFGYVCSVSPVSLLSDPEQLNEFMEMTRENGLIEAFNKVEDFYRQMLDRQKENDFR